jgi:hypothetical protein
MKKLPFALLLVALTSPGCVQTPLVPSAPEKAEVKPARPRAPVAQPDQVSTENAYQIADALRAELDAEATAVPPPAPPSSRREE